EKGQAHAPSLRSEPFIARLLAAVQMTLELHVHVEAPVDGDEPLDEVVRRLNAGSSKARRHRPSRAAGQADEPSGMLGEIIEAGRALSFRSAHLDAGQELAEIAVALLILDEERKSTTRLECHLGANERRQPETRAGAVETWRAVHAVRVHERDGRLLEPCRLVGDVLRQRRGVEEAEGAASVKLDEHGSARAQS